MNDKTFSEKNMKCLRNQFLNSFLDELKSNDIEYAVIRSHENIFTSLDKDVDMLVLPSDFSKVKKIYKSLILKYQGSPISYVVSNKNVYIKAFFVESDLDEIEFNGLYIHISGYCNVKTSFEARNTRYLGRKLFINDVECIDILAGDCELRVPNPKYQILLLLSKFSQNGRQKYLDEILKIVDRYTLNDWITNLDKQCWFNSNKTINPELFGLIENMLSSLGNANSKINFKEYVALIWINIADFFRFKGKLIFFSGPDGAGKTTANEALTKILKDKLKAKVVNFKHLYPLSNLLQVKTMTMQAKIRNLDINNKDELERDRGHSFSWKLRRLVGLIYILFQIYPGYLYARYLNLRGWSVIVDTSFFDAFIKGHRPSFPLVQKFTAPLIPAGDFWFLMSSTPEEIVNRKPELTKDEIAQYYVMLEKISGQSGKKPITIFSSKGVPLALESMLLSFRN